jgi:hypothetical protein
MRGQVEPSDKDCHNHTQACNISFEVYKYVFLFVNMAILVGMRDMATCCAAVWCLQDSPEGSYTQTITILNQNSYLSVAESVRNEVPKVLPEELQVRLVKATPCCVHPSCNISSQMI